jgi:anti-anti-sigma regulatory factor
MGVLVAAHADLAPAVRLVIVADGPTTSRPLKLVGIADLIELFATRDEALAAVTA